MIDLEGFSIFTESSEEKGILFKSYEPLSDKIEKFLDIIKDKADILHKNPDKEDVNLNDDIKKFKADIDIDIEPGPIVVSRIKSVITDIKQYRSNLDKTLNEYIRLRKSIAFGGNVFRGILNKPKVYVKEINSDKYTMVNNNIRNVNRALDWVEKSLIDLYGMIDQDLNILTIVGKVYGKTHIYENCNVINDLDPIYEASKSEIYKKSSDNFNNSEKNRKFDNLSDEELKLYIPDVYQKSIYPDDSNHIDFNKLKKHGIKFLSFDIDDTIIGYENRNITTGKPISISVKTINFFNDLKKDFKIVLLSNGSESRVKNIANKLGVEGIARAGKPDIEAFHKLQKQYGVKKSEMAHIGNHMVDDIYGGNAFGITTCLVRRKGNFTKIQSSLGLTAGTHLRKILKDRNMWYKHHQYENNDQYYQLGENPNYLKQKNDKSGKK